MIGNRLNRESALGLAGLLILALFLIAVFWQASINASVKADRVAPHGVALIDELSITDPNPSFISNFNRTVHQAGYWLDYYPPNDVSVGLFWALPALGYDVVVIRAHSTGWLPGDPISIITGQQYNTWDFQREQTTRMLYRSAIEQNKPAYFAVSSKFITQESSGNFPGSIVINMGCTGLINTPMASAFISKGAKAYVGWYGPILPYQTDTATLALTQSLFLNHTSLAKAVSQASSLVGEAPTYQYNGLTYLGGLGLYPETSGTMTIANA